MCDQETWNGDWKAPVAWEPQAELRQHLYFRTETPSYLYKPKTLDPKHRFEVCVH